MENAKPGNKTTTANEENPNIIINQSNVEMVNENENDNENENENRQPSTRTPFTNLSQVEADLALARTLQDQERAYMMLRNGGDYGSWEVGSYVHDNDDDFDDPIEDEYEDSDGEDEDEDGDDDIDDDVFDVHAHADSGEGNNRGVELDPASFPSDEAYARALQDSEEREMAARLLALAGINDMVSGDEELEDDVGNSQDTWDEVDPDELSYEELIALGEVVGTESRGLSADTIASLPSVNYKTQSNQDESNDPCVICRLDYEDGDTLTVLSCKHAYHSECINNWLQINKVCPVCSAEVSTSGHC